MNLHGQKVEVGIAIGLAAALAGLAALLLHMAVLTATQPGTSFFDNYWQGRLPWIPIAFGLMMAGLTAASVLGLMVVWLRGRALARVASVLPAVPIAFWWTWASLPPPGGVPCDPGTCSPKVADPIALAYSLPEAMVFYLVVPTAAILAVAVAAARRRPMPTSAESETEALSAGYLTRPQGTALPGTKGVESRFFDLAELVRCQRVLVADASFIPSEEEGCVVGLPVHTYRVQFSVMDYGPDWRIARLRLTSSDDVRRGPVIGQTWTDTARTGVCDIDLLQPAWGSDAEASYRRVAPSIEGDDAFGVAEFDASSRAIIPFVDSGFGDGEFPIYELLDAAGDRVGFEVEFIRRGSRYPP